MKGLMKKYFPVLDCGKVTDKIVLKKCNFSQWKKGSHKSCV